MADKLSYCIVRPGGLNEVRPAPAGPENNPVWLTRCDG